MFILQLFRVSVGYNFVGNKFETGNAAPGKILLFSVTVFFCISYFNFRSMRRLVINILLVT